MAIKEEFEIRISKDGELKIVAKGFSGNECSIPLKDFMKILKIDGRIEHTEDFYNIARTVDTKVEKK